MFRSLNPAPRRNLPLSDPADGRDPRQRDRSGTSVGNSELGFALACDSCNPRSGSPPKACGDDKQNQTCHSRTLLSGIQNRALALHVADAIHVLGPLQQFRFMNPAYGRNPQAGDHANMRDPRKRDRSGTRGDDKRRHFANIVSPQ
jgi:hypothetical protein